MKITKQELIQNGGVPSVSSSKYKGLSNLERKRYDSTNSAAISRIMNKNLKKTAQKEQITMQDKIRAGSDVLGASAGAIIGIARSKPKSTKDIVRKGLLGSFVGMETGDGLGDMASWIMDKKNALKKKKSKRT